MFNVGKVQTVEDVIAGTASTTLLPLLTDESRRLAESGMTVHVFYEDETVIIKAPPADALLKPTCGKPVEYVLRMYHTATGMSLHDKATSSEFFNEACCLKQNGEVNCKQVTPHIITMHVHACLSDFVCLCMPIRLCVCWRCLALVDCC